MGVPRDEPFASAKSDRQIDVTLTRGFWMQSTEVTVEDWTAAGLPAPEADWTLAGSSSQDKPPDGYGVCEGERCPVSWVTFEDAAYYANVRSRSARLEPCYELADCEREAGRRMRCRSVHVRAASPYACAGYRLPTEAEWEYAARAGTHTAFYSGAMLSNLDASYNCDLDPNLDAIGWYCGNSAVGPTRTKQAHPVAQKLPNAYGLYDVSGNVYEWTSDLYDPSGYGDRPRTNPIGASLDPSDLTPAIHPILGAYLEVDGYPGYRVSRGGSFDLWSYMAKSGRRNEIGSTGGQFTGFRLVRSAGPDEVVR